MSGLLYGIGALAVVVGAVLIGFGIPINEFSFGNTLIIAGTTTAVGGLIVVGLGVVVAQLQRLSEAIAARAPIRASRPLEIFESPAVSRSAPAEVPFPPKRKSDAGLREPHAFELPPVFSAAGGMPAEKAPAATFAPTLRNPYEAPATVEDEVLLSPQHPTSAPASAAADLDASARHAQPFDFNGPEMAENRQEAQQEQPLDAGWRSAPPQQTRAPNTAYFDAMWPADEKPAKSLLDTDDKPHELKFDPPPRESAVAPARRAEPEAPKQRQGNEARGVAILKSGVVDGMGYTLYVDGSIEAELPQGTLRFVSINELRSHLENNV
jgi:hypothetical protein